MAEVADALTRAISRHQAGDLGGAERAYRAILADHPDHADALHLLGLVAYQKGDAAAALEHICRAIAIDPRAAMYHANLGRVLMAQGRAADAAEAYREAVVLAPNDAAAHSDMAAALVTAGDFDAARPRARLALELDPNLAAAHLNLGLALQGGGASAAAGAEACFRRAAALDPNLADAHQALGQLHQARDEDDAAMECYRQAIRAHPGMAEAHCNLGNILRDRLDLTAALVQYDAGLAAAPDVAALHANRGVALHELGRFDDALASYDRALALDPDDAECQRNRAMTLLLLGRFTDGWPAYEARWRTARFKGQVRAGQKPRWTAGGAAGATVLVKAEQGLGDTIQFARYATLLAAAGQHVTLECPAALVRLMASLDGVIQVVAQGGGAPPPSHDFQIPLMSLPGVFATDITTIPADVPYLRAPEQDCAAWSRRLDKIPGPRIGIVWKGSPDHPRDRVRSPGLAPLLPLLDLPGAAFVSLQKDGRADLAAHGADGVVDMTADLGDFAATAGLVECLDLVVTCDTAVGHLAGALGRPVAMLLPQVPEWRWLLDRHDTPWYPTMHLFRQSAAGDWNGAVNTLAAYIRRHWL
ncbi:MAG: tetratricopeptide repeat protein [Rhodospirillales bacterium]